MKKTILCLLLILLSLSSLASAQDKPATLMLYLCGSDLSASAVSNLDQLLSLPDTSNVNICVLYGGSKEWEDSRFPDGETGLIFIADGEIVSHDSWGRKNMGDPQTLEDFVVTCMRTCPSERNMLVLWNHGAGSLGICFDEVFNDDWLTLAGIQKALSGADAALGGLHLDMIGCDACLMATYELAVLASRYANYYVGSQELEPSSGWNYDGFLSVLNSAPWMDSPSLYQILQEDYFTQNLDLDPDAYLTLSIVDCSRIPELSRSMEALTASVNAQVKNSDVLSAFSRDRSRMYEFGEFKDNAWDMVDMNEVIRSFARYDEASAGKASAALDACVLSTMKSDNLGKCSGLSVLIPRKTANNFANLEEGYAMNLLPSQETFAKSYANFQKTGSYTFSREEATSVQVDNRRQEEAQSTPAPGEVPAFASSDSALFGFQTTLSQKDMENLAYAEGSLMMDLSDPDMEYYLDLGYMPDTDIDWENRSVISCFDGTWPFLGEFVAPIYTQSETEKVTRSLIPATVNGIETYLLVSFEGDKAHGRIVGYNSGVDESNKFPSRETHQLKEGDVITLQYSIYYGATTAEELQTDTYETEPFLWKKGMTVEYQSLRDAEKTNFLFSFILNDVYGGYTVTDPIPLSI